MAENCPAVTFGEDAPCRWVPIVADMDHSRWVQREYRGGHTRTIGIIEVCPACRQYRVVDYVPAEDIVPRDPNGVHSTP